MDGEVFRRHGAGRHEADQWLRRTGANRPFFDRLGGFCYGRVGRVSSTSSGGLGRSVCFSSRRPGGGGNMKTATASYPQPLALTRSRVADYLELTKPRISLMVLVTVAAGAIVGARGV